VIHAWVLCVYLGAKRRYINTLHFLFFFCFSCEDIARQSCAMVPIWRIFLRFFASCISASRVQHVSDLHPKFVLRPHHVWKYGRYSVCDNWDYAREKRKIEERNKKKPQGKHIMSAATHGGHNCDRERKTVNLHNRWARLLQNEIIFNFRPVGILCIWPRRLQRGYVFICALCSATCYGRPME